MLFCCLKIKLCYLIVIGDRYFITYSRLYESNAVQYLGRQAILTDVGSNKYNCKCDIYGNIDTYDMIFSFGSTYGKRVHVINPCNLLNTKYSSICYLCKRINNYDMEIMK
jgi:hypothetical protein